MMTIDALRNYCTLALTTLRARGTELRIQHLQGDILGRTIYRAGQRPLILINDILVNESPKVIDTIIAHEYAHVVAGAAAGHNRQWYAIANKFSATLGGFRVTKDVVDCLNLSETFWKTNFRYVYRCSCCDKLIGFNDSQYSTIPTTITHNNCGGSWIKVK